MALRHALLALLALGAAMRPAHAQSGGDASCAAAAATTLELPACRGVAARVAAATGAAAEDQPCPGACAELWLGVAAGCGGGKGDPALEAAAPGVTRACRATAAAALATPPPSITVAGLACHPIANGRYELEPVPQNGGPHYTTAGGAMHLYWTPHYQ